MTREEELRVMLAVYRTVDNSLTAILETSVDALYEYSDEVFDIIEELEAELYELEAEEL